MAAGATQADCVLEVGAGTGAITRVLAQRVPVSKLVIIEPNQSWAAGLRAQFPRATVHAAMLHELEHVLQSLPKRTKVVSSLPFRSLPADVLGPTLGVLLPFLQSSPGRELTQFSYQPRPPFRAPEGMRWKLQNVVLANLPPAGVWELHAVGPAGGAISPQTASPAP